MIHCKKSTYVKCWARLKRGIDHFGAAAAMENEEWSEGSEKDPDPSRSLTSCHLDCKIHEHLWREKLKTRKRKRTWSGLQKWSVVLLVTIQNLRKSGYFSFFVLNMAVSNEFRDLAQWFCIDKRYNRNTWSAGRWQWTLIFSSHLPFNLILPSRCLM